MAAKYSASIIIIVKNDPGIEGTLKAIEAQKASEHIETIVVDASAPAELLAIRKKYPRVRWDYYDQKEKRFTFAEQRNRGLDLARGEIIIFIDASCEPTNKWLSSLIKSIREGEFIVTGPCRPSNSKNLVDYIKEHKAKTYVPECTTVNVALHKDVVKHLGKFDVALNYGEDVDYFWRAVDMGYNLCYNPDAGITHDFGNAEEQFKRAYRYGKSRAILHRKHWRVRWFRLLRYEPHVWMYPLFILLLPITFWIPLYPCLLLIPLIKNRSFRVVAHHFIFATGVLSGALFS